ncbi:baseplate wedge tail fiber protein connector [Erwinia phage Cronus]|uniref:Baseplate wedge tail fiber connector n=1 Tax=Erwinia phage Cronus TaxID=2163633 RepID=A0A2S1GLP5_9CAUD|nr:baseplate wedge tail fiber protein connector [Erwinia phage Cronus]AWD90305.1 baseplate wedge tail fiber connector [Erwinia phage Cronus]
MAIQNADKKQLIDVGEIGNASTGDILFDGGEKINAVFNQMYNTFGNKTLSETAEGVGLQTLYGTGYFQKGTQLELSAVIPNGSQYDIDTSSGSQIIRLSKGVRGEFVRFSNSNGSWSVNNPLLISANDSFKGISGQLRVTSPYSIVECWCISDANGVSTWDYSIKSMFGDGVAAINTTVELTTEAKTLSICHKSEYNLIKLLMTASSITGSKQKSSEVNLLVDAVNNIVYNTEFASIRVGGTNDDDEIYDATFSINASGFVTVAVRTSTAGMKLAIKTIDTQKIGVSQ